MTLFVPHIEWISDDEIYNTNKYAQVLPELGINRILRESFDPPVDND